MHGSIVQLIPTMKLIEGVFNLVFDETCFPLLRRISPCHPEYASKILSYANEMKQDLKTLKQKETLQQVECHCRV